MHTTLRYFQVLVFFVFAGLIGCKSNPSAPTNEPGLTLLADGADTVLVNSGDTSSFAVHVTSSGVAVDGVTVTVTDSSVNRTTLGQTSRGDYIYHYTAGHTGLFPIIFHASKQGYTADSLRKYVRVTNSGPFALNVAVNTASPTSLRATWTRDPSDNGADTVFAISSASLVSAIVPAPGTRPSSMAFSSTTSIAFQCILRSGSLKLFHGKPPICSDLSGSTKLRIPLRIRTQD